MLASLEKIKNFNLEIKKRLFQSLFYLSSFSGKPYENRILEIVEQLSEKAPSPFLYAFNKKLAFLTETENLEKSKKFIQIINYIQKENTFIYSYNELNKLKKYLFNLYTNSGNDEGENFKKVKSFSFAKKKIYESLSLLKSFPEYENFFIEELIQMIIIFNSEKMVAGSSSELYGSIYINEDYISSNLYSNIEVILHEASHVYLYMFSFFDKIILNPIEELFTSSIRKDKRPMIGIFHGAFVTKNLISFYEKNRKTIPTAEERIQILKRKNNLLEKCIKDNGKLTKIGKKLLS